MKILYSAVCVLSLLLVSCSSPKSYRGEESARLIGRSDFVVAAAAAPGFVSEVIQTINRLEYEYYQAKESARQSRKTGQRLQKGIPDPLGSIDPSPIVPSTEPPKPNRGDKKLMANTYEVSCLECDETGQIKHRLNPISVFSNGGRSTDPSSATQGIIRSIAFTFKCPAEHEFSAPGPDQFIPRVTAALVNEAPKWGGKWEASPLPPTPPVLRK